MPQVSRKILRDSPAKSDSFSGGGHERTAGVLATTVAELGEQDSVIGIDGKWGSGKSSVIEMAETKLKEAVPEKTFHVYTYDLWANQSVGFRRGFLEGFLAWASGREAFAANSGDISDLRNRLGGKSKEIINTTKANFNWFGYIALFVGLLSPLIYLWLSPVAVRSPTQPNCAPNCPPPTWLQLFIENGTLISAGIVVLVLLAFGARVAQASWNAKSIPEGLSDAVHLFSKKSNQEVTTELIRDIDPTSFEFSASFRTVHSKLSSEKQKLVFVFDNIDRLHPEHARSAWSDIQSVVGHANIEAVVQRPLTIIVPFDRGSIERAFVPNDQAATQDRDDLFRKSFDIIVSVAQPVISDLKGFFKNQLGYALFDTIDNALCDRVAKIFDYAVTESMQAPTPRWINSFINDLTTIWVQWEGQIPLDAIAVFVANRSLLDAKRDASTITAIVNSSCALRADCSREDLAAYLAMITFSAPRDLALEVMLADPIYRALQGYSADGLSELQKSPAFDEMLARVVEMRRTEFSDDAPRFSRVVGNLIAIDPKRERHTETARLIAEQVDHLGTLHPRSFDTYKNILKAPLLAHPSSRRQSIDSMCRWLNRCVTEKKSPDEADGTYWVKAIGMLKANLAETAPEIDWIAVQEQIEIPKYAAFVCGVAYVCDQAELKLRDFDVSKSLDGVVAHLSQQIDEGLEELIYKIQELRPVLSAKDRDELRQKMIEYLAAQSNDVYDENVSVGQYFENLSEICAEPPTTKTKSDLTDFFRQGDFAFYLFKKYETKPSEEWSVEDARLFTHYINLGGNDHVPIDSPQQHPRFGDISEAVSWLHAFIDGAKFPKGLTNSVATIARQLHQETSFKDFAIDPKCKRPLLKRIGRTLLSGPHQRIFHAADFVKQFDALRSLAGDDTELIHRYGLHFERPNEPWKEVAALALPSTLVAFENEASEDLRWPLLMERLDQEIQEQSADAWTQALKDDEAWLELAAIRIEKEKLTLPVNSFKEPFISHLVAVALKGQTICSDADTLFIALPPQSRTSAANTILKRLSASGVSSDGIVRLLSGAASIVQRMDLAANANFAFDALLRPILDAPTEATTTYVEQNKDAFREAISASGDTASAEVAAVLTSLTGADEMIALRDRLASALQIKFPKPEAHEDEIAETEESDPEN